MTIKRYYVVSQSMRGHLDHAENIVCCSNKDLRLELASIRSEYERNEYDVINSVNDIINNRYEEAEYIRTYNNWSVTVQRVYAIEKKSVEIRMARDFSNEYEFAQSDFDYRHLGYLAEKQVWGFFMDYHYNVITAGFYKGDLNNPSEIWLTDSSRPYGIYTEYVRMI